MSEKESIQRSTRITWASEIRPVPPRWVWKQDTHGRMPAGVLVLAGGREGTGKSSFGIWLASQLSRGVLPGTLQGVPSKVFYLAIEDSWAHTLVPRLIAAEADLSHIGRFDVVTEVGEQVTLSLPKDLGLLETSIQHEGPAMIIIDPLMSVIGSHINTHNEREVRLALDPLVQLARRTGVVILGITHFNKSRGTDVATLITGSGAFRNVPRAIFGFVRDETDDQDTRVMTQVKNSLGRTDLPSFTYTIKAAAVNTPEGVMETGRFVFTGTSERDVADVLRDLNGDVDVAAARNAKSFIAKYLKDAGGRALSNEVIAAGVDEGFKEQTLKNARKRVAGTKREGRQPHQKTFWILPQRSLPRRDSGGSGSRSGTSGTDPVGVVPEVPEGVSEESIVGESGRFTMTEHGYLNRHGGGDSID